MPVHNRIFTPSPIIFDPVALLNNGPILTVEISIPNALATLLTSQNQPIPSPSTGYALIDTGATRTCVDHQVITQLGVNPVGTITSGTAGGTVNQSLFPAHVRFPQESIDLDFNACVGVNLTGQTALSQPIIALIGRDILQHLLFIYNGPAGMFTVTT